MQLHMQSLQAAWNAVYMLQKIWLPLRARTLLGAPGIALGAKSLLVGPFENTFRIQLVLKVASALESRSHGVTELEKRAS